MVAQVKQENPNPTDTHFVCLCCKRRISDGFYRGPCGHTAMINGRKFRTFDLCLECFIDSHIPRDYIRREMYVAGNATRRPPLGIDWLDQRSMSLAESLPMCGRKPRQYNGRQ